MPTPQIMQEMDNVLSKDIVDRHSFFQLKHFVVGREYTTQGRMWQCLREIRSRKSWIEAYTIEIEEAKDRIELLDIDKERNALFLSDLLRTERNENLRNLAKKETSVKCRQINRQVTSILASIEGLKKKIADYEEEARFYIAEFRQLEEVEPLLPLDDLGAQKEYWTAKLFQEINLKMLLQQPLDAEMVKMVLALNDDSALKQQMLKLLEGNRRAIQAEAVKKLTPQERIDAHIIPTHQQP